MTEDWDQRVCLAAAFFVADGLTGDRSSVRVVEVPERQKHESGPKVELVCSIGDEEVAFEHTQIESYEGQIQDGHHIPGFTDKVNTALGAPLPEGTFTLQLATDAVSGLAGKAADSAAHELARWVDRAAPGLAEGHNDDVPSSSQLEIESSIEGRMWFRPGDNSRELQFKRLVPDGLEERRTERIKRAYEDKLPKLAAEHERGRMRCLVMEDQDISLANAILTQTAAIKAFDGFQDVQPEWILLVETGIAPSQWLALSRSGEWPGLNLNEFSPIEVPHSLDAE